MKGVWCSGGEVNGWARVCEEGSNGVEVSLLVGGYYRTLVLTPEQAHAFAEQIHGTAYRIEAAAASATKPAEDKKK